MGFKNLGKLDYKKRSTFKSLSISGTITTGYNSARKKTWAIDRLCRKGVQKSMISYFIARKQNAIKYDLILYEFLFDCMQTACKKHFWFCNFGYEILLSNTQRTIEPLDISRRSGSFNLF